MHREVAIALGANLGNRLSQIQAAKEKFKKDCATGTRWAQSSVYETAPVDCAKNTPSYLNAVISFLYHGTPEELLQFCKNLEREMGRLIDGATGQINQPRVIDADILYLGDECLSLPHLTLPHPRMKARRFVLVPLAEIRPGLILPHEHKTISQLLKDLNSEEPPPVIVEKDW